MQKTVHILKELGAPFQERFEYSYYGMYSAQLKGELDALEKEGLVKESESFATTNKIYIIETQPKAGELLKEVGLAEPPEWTELAKNLIKLPVQVLEGISTILFLRRTEKEDAVIRQRLLSLKPHLEPQADACFAEVKQLPRFA